MMKKMQKNSSQEGKSQVLMYIISLCLITVYLIGYIFLSIYTDSLITLYYSITFSILLFVLVLITLFKHLKSKSMFFEKFSHYSQILTSLFKLSDYLFTFTHQTLNRIAACFGDDTTGKHSSMINEAAEVYKALSDVQYLCFLPEKTGDEKKTICPSEILRKMASHIYSDMEVLTGKLEQIQQPLLDDLTKRCTIYEQRDLFHQLIAGYSVSTNVVSSFISAIILNSNKTGKKMSGQIYNIRKNIDQFLKNISIWKNNFLSKTSEINFEKLISEYKTQNRKFSEISGQISANYSDIVHKLNNFKSLLENIFNNIEYIKDISESINVLSINAAIEAARVGEPGKGFRIIAGEIKKLLIDTESFVKNIITSIEDTKDIVVATTEDSKIKAKQIVDNITLLKDDTDTSFNMLDLYYKNFNNMIDSMKHLTEEVKFHMDDFTVILQHFDIEEQELDNLSKILCMNISHNSSQVKTVLDTMNNEERNRIFKDLLDFVNNIITTKIELKTLENLYREYGLYSGFQSAKIGPDIELFMPVCQEKE